MRGWLLGIRSFGEEQPWLGLSLGSPRNPETKYGWLLHSRFAGAATNPYPCVNTVCLFCQLLCCVVSLP